MEEIKEKLPMIISIIILIILGGLAYYLLFYQQSVYYTKIDNTKIERISASDNMKYEYSLTCYNEQNKSKEIKFRTSRQLKEGAYLKLKVMVTRGVIEWEEVQEEELPDEVKINYIQ